MFTRAFCFCILIQLSNLVLNGGCSSEQASPQGHLQPIGKQGPRLGSISQIDGFPNAETFYREYVRESRPLLMRGAALSLPAFKEWTDDNLKYVRHLFDCEII